MTAQLCGDAAESPAPHRKTAPGRTGRCLHAVAVISVAAGLAVAALNFGLVLAQQFGYHPYTVLTGSMVPTLPVGSVILTEMVPGSAVKPGDIITFQVPGRPELVVTHRVQSIVSVADGLYFVTRGDANAVADGWRVPVAATTQRVVADLPMAGLLGTVEAKILLFLVPSLLLIAVSVADRRRSGPTPRRAPEVVIDLRTGIAG